MNNDSITWTGTPDDQRAEWKGLIACFRKHGTCEHPYGKTDAWQTGVCRDDGRPESEMPNIVSLGVVCLSDDDAKWLCELVMWHEAAKARIAELEAELEQTRKGGE